MGIIYPRFINVVIISIYLPMFIQHGHYIPTFNNC